MKRTRKPIRTPDGIADPLTGELLPAPATGPTCGEVIQIGLAVAAIILLALLWAADARAAAPAPADPAPAPATLRLVVTLEVLPDGTSRVVSSETLTPELLGRLVEQLAADRAAVAARSARAEVEAKAKASKATADAGDPQPARTQAPTPTAAADADAEKPLFPGQCKAIAKSTGKRCRNRASAGSDYCHCHQPE